MLACRREKNGSDWRTQSDLKRRKLSAAPGLGSHFNRYRKQGKRTVLIDAATGRRLPLVYADLQIWLEARNLIDASLSSERQADTHRFCCCCCCCCCLVGWLVGWLAGWLGLGGYLFVFVCVCFCFVLFCVLFNYISFRNKREDMLVEVAGECWPSDNIRKGRVLQSQVYSSH